MPLKNVIHETDEKMKKTVLSVKREFSEIRSGRASPALVEEF